MNDNAGSARPTLLFQDRLDDILFWVDHKLPEASPEARSAFAWEQMVRLCQRFEADLSPADAKQFEAQPWYPMAWNFQTALTSICTALLAMVRATPGRFHDRRDRLEDMNALFRSLLDSNACAEYRQRFPASHRSALFMALARVDNAFENMFFMAQRSELHDPEFVRTVCIDVGAATGTLFRLWEYEASERSDKADEDRFDFQYKCVTWDRKPLNICEAERHVLHRVVQSKDEDFVPYADLERARGVPIDTSVVKEQADDLRPIVSRINAALVEVLCPLTLKAKRGCGYYLVRREDVEEEAGDT